MGNRPENGGINTRVFKKKKGCKKGEKGVSGKKIKKKLKKNRYSLEK